MKREWIKQAYETAKEHGFHDVEVSKEHLLMLVICEVGEAIEADRKDAISEDDLFKVHIMDFGNEGRTYQMSYRRYIKGSVSEEMADICIRLFDMAGLYGWDVMPTQEDEEGGKAWDYLYERCTFVEQALALCKLLCEEVNDEIRARIAVAYVYWWAKKRGIDLDFHIEMKMRYNKMRTRLHGKKY